MSTSIVTTTIHVPALLEKYAENARAHGRSQLEFIVVGDRKTPAGARAFCDRIAERYFPCEYLDLADQRRYLERFPALWNHLRLDSIQRRNIGMLRAYENGSDVVITIDDDNWIMNHDFAGLHGRVGGVCELPSIESTSGWFNVCSLLEERHATPFYHRGYPMGQRWNERDAFISISRCSRRVAVNAGFWLDDPDIDALTRINRQLVVSGFREGAPPAAALEPGTWSPFNSQNTALARDVLPAYFLSPYIGRYDDIWASYIVGCIAGHLDQAIVFGEPLVRQKRNAHDLWRDLDAERNGMLMTDSFCRALRAVPLAGPDYHACLGEVIAGLEEGWPPEQGWTESMREWRSRLLEGLGIWHAVFEELKTWGGLAGLSRAGAGGEHA